jgi:YHS domain-containing protein
MLRRISLSLLFVAIVSLFAIGCASQNKASATKPYMLSTCIVQDEPLGGMGAPISYVHEGQEVKFCCSHCVDDFKKDPEKYLKKLADASNKPTTKPS